MSRRGKDTLEDGPFASEGVVRNWLDEERNRSPKRKAAENLELLFPGLVNLRTVESLAVIVRIRWFVLFCDLILGSKLNSFA